MKTTTLLTLGLLFLAPLARATGAATLIRLYEEEILAHDLYVALSEKFPDVMPLQNIPRSELRHREALAAVLKADGIEMPKPQEGHRFVTAGLDETFAQWLADGQKSVADACRAGVRLEDHDIAELRQAQTDFPAHKEVLAQLEAASNNHLRAFHRNLTARGGAYTPEALPAADFKAILAGTGGINGCGAACGLTGCGPGVTPGGKGLGTGNGKATNKGKKRD